MCFKAEQAFDNHGVISMIKNESHVGIFGCIRQTSGLKEGGEGCSDGGQCPTVEQEMPQVEAFKARIKKAMRRERVINLSTSPGISATAHVTFSPS